MKFNKILIAVLLLFILTVGVVSASDDAVDMLATGEDIQLNEAENQISSFSNLSDEINSVESGSTIVLKTDYEYNSTVDENNGILINKSLIIDGDNHYVDASGSYMIFDIQTDNLSLKNIVFKNLGSTNTFVCNAYNCTFMGAAISYDVLFKGEFHDCTFIDCRSDIGTKIFEGTAYGTSFINCTAKGSSDAVLDKLVNSTVVNFRDSRKENEISLVISSILNGKGPGIKFKSNYDNDGDISFRGVYTVIVTNLTETSNNINLKFSKNAYNKYDYDFGQAVPDFYTVDLSDLEKGNYSIFVLFSGDLLYAPCNASAIMEVTRNPGEPFDFSDLSQLIKDFINEDCLLGHEYDRQGTLQLNSDFKFNPERDGDICDAGILIDYLMCIDANGHYIDAEGVSKVLNLTQSGSYEFMGYYDVKNIIFRNLTRDSLYVARAFNCTFIGGEASEEALANGYFDSCTFIGCHADNPINYIFKGTAYNCTFVNCSGWCGSDAALGELLNPTLINFQDSRKKSNIQLDIIINETSAHITATAECMDAFNSILITVDNQTAEVKMDLNYNNIVHADLSNLEYGNHTVFAQFAGDELYQSSNATDTFTIAPKVYEPKLIASNLVIQYNDGSKFTVTLYGFDGLALPNEEIIFKIDGKKVKTVKTNTNGQASIAIAQLPKTYKISAETSTLKTKISINKKLTVKRILSLKSVTVKKSAKKLVLTATLSKVKGKYLNGKKITFKFNGKSYSAKTNSKGVAKVTVKSSVLKKLKVGKKVTYQATYIKDTVKKSVKVKK